MAGLRAAALSGRLPGTEEEPGPGLRALLAFGRRTSGDRWPDPALLPLWFGADEFRQLVAYDGTPEGRADAVARLEEAVDRDVAALDALISAQLDAVLHAPRLRRLEGSWRGLAWLAGRMPPGARVKLRLLAARWPEICRDFDRAAEFDQSHVFRKVYEEEFGTPGGEPFGLLLADYEVRHRPAKDHPTDDVAALEGLAGVAAAAFAPTAVAAAPALLGLDAWDEASPATDLADPLLRAADRHPWRRLQAREDTRFLAVLLPRLLARAPWPDDGARADRFRYREWAPDTGCRVWTSPVYALAATAIRAFARHGWPADIRGAAIGTEAAGGVVDALPVERLPADPRGAPPPRPPVDLALTDEQERQAVEAGLLPLIGLEGLPEAAFAAAVSLHRPPRMAGADADAAAANQRLSAQFNAVLCVSRFAHCVKLMGRHMVGSFKTADEIESRLQRWLQRYVNAAAGAAAETGARYPLREARVEVRERPGQPGVFGCVVHMRPHHQLDEIGATFRLVTDLQAARAAA